MFDINAIHTVTAAHLERRTNTALHLAANEDVGHVIYTLSDGDRLRNVCSYGHFAGNFDVGTRHDMYVSGRRAGRFQIVAITEDEDVEGDRNSADTPARTYVAK